MYINFPIRIGMKEFFLNFFLLDRYLSDGELLDSAGGVVTTSGIETSTSPPRTYYVWKDPPQTHAGYDMSYATDAGASSPIRHTSYASQVGYYLQQQPPQLQSGGPRTTPSGYPGT